MLAGAEVTEWRGEVASAEIEALHAEGFGHAPTEFDWRRQLAAHSLGWVTAREAGSLVGFVNVAWDGADHAFVLDTVVAAGHRRRGLGTALVEHAVREARRAGCEWLHVDFEPHLRGFYLDCCGFGPTGAGLVRLKG